MYQYFLPLCWLECHVTVSLKGFPAVCASWNIVTLSLYQDFLPSVLAEMSSHCLFNMISYHLCLLEYRANVSLTGFLAVCAGWNIVPLSFFQDFLPSVVAGISCHCLFNRISCRLCWLKYRDTVSFPGFPAFCSGWNIVPLSL